MKFDDSQLRAQLLLLLQASVLVSVIVMMLVTVAVLVANVWLEAGRSAEHFPAGMLEGSEL